MVPGAVAGPVYYMGVVFWILARLFAIILFAQLLE
jgi:hypothetical protein